MNNYIKFTQILCCFLLLNASAVMSADPINDQELEQKLEQLLDEMEKDVAKVAHEQPRPDERQMMQNFLRYGELPPAANKGYIVVETHNGLGNQLRSIGSLDIMAKLTNRIPIVIWHKDAHMQAQWQDLFLTPLNTFEDSALPEFGFSLKRIQTARENDPLIKNLGIQNSNLATRIVLSRIPTMKELIIYFVTSNAFKSEAMSMPEYYNKMREFMKSLTPVKDIEDEVKSFRLQHNFDAYTMMGLHYRGWQTGVTDDNAKLKRDPHNRYINLFHQHMNDLLKTPSDKPRAFFLATDNQAAKDALMNAPGWEGRVFTRSIVVKRDSVDDVKNALIDIYLLGSGLRVYGTTQSSLSFIAACLTEERRKVGIGEDPYSS